MKKKYVSPELDIFYDVAEPILAGASHNDIETVPNNDKNGGNILGDTPGIDLGEDYDPGTDGENTGDLESKFGNWGIWGRDDFE